MADKKIIIFYYSYSSMSTEKLLKGIKETISNIELLLLPSEEKNDVSSYDLIGFHQEFMLGILENQYIKKLKC